MPRHILENFSFSLVTIVKFSLVRFLGILHGSLDDRHTDEAEGSLTLPRSLNYKLALNHIRT